MFYKTCPIKNYSNHKICRKICLNSSKYFAIFVLNW